MVHQPSPDEYDHREEGTSLLDFPLLPSDLAKSAGELVDALFDAIHRLNADPQWDRTLIYPRLGDVIVDRERRQMSARIMWKIKPDYQTKGTKK